MRTPAAAPSVTSSRGCVGLVSRPPVWLCPLDPRRVAVVGVEHVLPPVGDECVHELRLAALSGLGRLRLECLDGRLRPGAEQAFQVLVRDARRVFVEAEVIVQPGRPDGRGVEDVGFRAELRGGGGGSATSRLRTGWATGPLSSSSVPNQTARPGHWRTQAGATLCSTRGKHMMHCWLTWRTKLK